eukprot:s2436_g2.t1
MTEFKSPLRAAFGSVAFRRRNESLCGVVAMAGGKPAALPLDTPFWDEIREKLDRIAADLKCQKDLQTEPGAWLVFFSNCELLKSIKALTFGVSLQPSQAKSAKKPPKAKEFVRARSLLELQSKMFEESIASHHLSGQLDNSPVSDSAISRPGELGEPVGPIESSKSLVSLIPRGPVAPPGELLDPERCKAMPGVLPESSPSSPNSAGQEVMVSDRERNSKRQKPSTRVKLCQMNEESQTHILGSLSFCSIQSDVPVDAGSRLILAMPSFIYFALGILVLCETALAVACGPVHCPSDAGLRSTVIESITYGIAAAFSIALMKKALGSSNLKLGQVERKLAVGRLYTFVAEFQVDWSQVSGKEGCKYVAVWLMMILVLIAARCLGTLYRLNSSSFVFDLTHEVMLNSMEVLSVLTYCVSSALVTAAAYAQSHLLLGLDKSLDCWCSRILALPDFREGVQSWNALQALLKSIGRELADTFLILQIFGSLCFMFFLVNGVILVFEDLDAIPWIVEVLSGVPLLFMSCLSLKVSAHGAALTEKCRAIPPFVNQIPTEELIDQERQYLVRFITDSSAGFCVRDVKLTQEMVMKEIYILGALLSATISALSRALI